MNNIVIFTENRQMVEMLTDRDAGKLLKALLAHAAGEEPADLTKPAQMLYMVMAGQADRMEASYQESRKKRIEAGRAGGLAKASNASNAKQSLATNTNTNTNTNVITAPARVKKNSFFDFAQRTDQDLDAIVRREM